MARLYLQEGRCIYCGAYSAMLLSLCGWPGMVCEACVFGEGESEDDEEVEEEEGVEEEERFPVDGQVCR